MLIVLLLCSGIDMIGDMPSRVISTKEVVETIEPVEVIEPGEVIKPVKPAKSKKVKSKEKEQVEPPKEEVPEIPDTEPENELIPFPEDIMIPFPKVDELEPGEKEVEVIDNSEDGYKYYVYRSHNCTPCVKLINELKKNVDEKDLILSYERTTKSGKYVTYVPVLEIYKDGELIHQQTGYTSWKTIQGKLSEIN